MRWEFVLVYLAFLCYVSYVARVKLDCNEENRILRQWQACGFCMVSLISLVKALADYLHRFGKRELVLLLSFTRKSVVSVRRSSPTSGCLVKAALF